MNCNEDVPAVERVHALHSIQSERGPITDVLGCECLFHGLERRGCGGVQATSNNSSPHADSRDMVFDVAQLVAHASSFLTLEPGDLIATGTPEQVAASKKSFTGEYLRPLLNGVAERKPAKKRR